MPANLGVTIGEFVAPHTPYAPRDRIRLATFGAGPPIGPSVPSGPPVGHIAGAETAVATIAGVETDLP